ncbi:hypothetical protein P7C71_g3377, partial [Lecanoromycetidae sp. Uapishka_2]
MLRNLSAPADDPDLGASNNCQCPNGSTYAELTQGTATDPNFGGCIFPVVNGVIVATPTNEAGDCSGIASDCTDNDPSVQALIAQGQAEELASCSNLTFHVNNPGTLQLALGGTCADVLNIMDHMFWWWDQNQATCTQNTVGFADCFFDLVPGYQNTNCSRLDSGQPYCRNPDPSDFKGVNQTLDFYTAWNIYNFNVWATNYYQAMYNGDVIASGAIWNTSTAFTHLKPPDLTAEIVLSIFTFVLGLISPSGWAERLPGDASAEKPQSSFWRAVESPGEYLLRATQQSPGLAHGLLPTGNLNDAVIAAEETDAQLAQYVQGLTFAITGIAETVPQNVTALADWFASGYFFNAPPDEGTMTQTITSALNTYIISQLLQDNNVFVATALDTSPVEFGQNGTTLANKPDLLDCPSYDQWSMCNEWFWDNITNTAFSLHQHTNTFGGWTNWSTDLHTLFNNGLITPQDLFLGSFYCSLDGNSTNDAIIEAAINSTNGGISLACLSDMPVCTWNLQNQTEWVEPDCPQDYLEGTENNCLELDDDGVPYDYLGWWYYHVCSYP